MFIVFIKIYNIKPDKMFKLFIRKAKINSFILEFIFYFLISDRRNEKVLPFFLYIFSAPANLDNCWAASPKIQSPQSYHDDQYRALKIHCTFNIIWKICRENI